MQPRGKSKNITGDLFRKKQVSDICETYGIAPNVFYRWQKQFFENGKHAFETTSAKQKNKESERIAFLEGKLRKLVQFEQDSKPWLPIILAGQSNLIDKLMYRASMPLASRIVGRSHPDGIDRQAMENYLQHHLSLAGMKQNPFDQSALTAIHQGSGGIFRKANHLARGALISAAAEKALGVTAEHVRMAATEIF